MSINGHTLFNRSLKAFRDYAPVGYSRSKGLYRSFRWGKNLEVFFLDERSFRSANADANHVCDNPQTGRPDLAPTAPQSTAARGREDPGAALALWRRPFSSPPP